MFFAISWSQSRRTGRIERLLAYPCVAELSLTPRILGIIARIPAAFLSSAYIRSVDVVIRASLPPCAGMITSGVPLRNNCRAVAARLCFWRYRGSLLLRGAAKYGALSLCLQEGSGVEWDVVQRPAALSKTSAKWTIRRNRCLPRWNDCPGSSRRSAGYLAVNRRAWKH